MKLGDILKWLPIIFLTFRHGDSMHQSGSIPILDDEDFFSPYYHGSGDAYKPNAVGELQDEISPVADGAWMTENDGSASGKEGIGEAQGKTLLNEEQEISDLYIDDEEAMPSGIWKDPFGDENDLDFISVNAIHASVFDNSFQAFDITEQDSSGLQLDSLANQADDDDAAFDPTNKGKSGPSVQLCQVKSCPNACPTEHRVNEKTEFAVGDIMYITVLDKNISDGEVLSIQNAGFACNEESNLLGAKIKSGCTVDSELIVESTVGSVSCLSLRMPRTISCSKAYLRVEVASCAVADLEMCVNNATILRCASTFARRLKRSSKPYAKSGVAFNTRYKNAGKMTIKPFPDLVEGRPVSSSSNSDKSGRTELVVPAISTTIGVLLSMTIVCTIYIFVSRYD